MNPFEVGFVGSEGRGGGTCPFFYNPMWGMLGDSGSSAPATYFYNSGTEVNYFWNTFDQVLLRPSLLSSLSNRGINVATSIGAVTLLNTLGRPDANTASDHLPVICRLSDIEENVNA